VIQEVDVLSEREIRVLSEIEEGLALRDPDFADLMTTLPGEAPGPRARPTELLIILGASLLPTMCMVLAHVGAGLVAAVFAVAVFALYRAWVWRPGQRLWCTGRWAE
jgi:Flp pilus assembly protein TadB